MIILDSDVVIEIEHANREVIAALGELKYNHSESIAITAAVYSEVYLGLLLLTEAKARNALEGLEAYEVLDFDKDAAMILSKLKLYLEKAGKTIPIFDLITASIAINRNAVLVSFDEHFERIPNLKLIKLMV